MQLDKLAMLIVVTALALILSTECYRFAGIAERSESLSISVEEAAGFMVHPVLLRDAEAALSTALSSLPAGSRRDVEQAVEDAVKSRRTMDIAEAKQLLAVAIASCTEKSDITRSWIEKALDANSSLAEAFKACADPSEAKANVEKIVQHRFDLPNATARQLIAAVIKQNPSTALDARALNAELQQKSPLLGIRKEADAQAYLRSALDAIPKGLRQTAIENVKEFMKTRKDVDVTQANALLAAALRTHPNNPYQQKKRFQRAMEWLDAFN